MKRAEYILSFVAMSAAALGILCLIAGEQGRVERAYERGVVAGSNAVVSKPPPVAVTTQAAPVTLQVQIVDAAGRPVVTNEVDVEKLLNQLTAPQQYETNDAPWRAGNYVIPEPRSPFDLPLPK